MNPRGLTAWAAGFLAAFVIGLPLGIILLLGGGNDADCQAAADPSAAGASGTPSQEVGVLPSQAGPNGIPTNYLAIYVATGQQFKVPWYVLAGIGKVETDHGRLKAPGVTGGLNAFGCCAGPMQFNLKNGPPSTWDSYGIDGNGDGRKSPWDPRDAIPSAGKYIATLLQQNGGSIPRALYGYNQAWWYVAKVLGNARQYQQSTARLPSVAPAPTRTTTTERPRSGTLSLGDSLAVGTRDLLKGLRTIARTSSTTSQAASRLAGAGDLPATLVVQLGTNDTNAKTFARDVKRILDLARRGGATRVLWVDIARKPLDGSRDTQLNDVLQAAARRHDELELVGWKALVDAKRVTLPDGVHPTPAGYRVRADLITAALEQTSAAPAAAPANSDTALGSCGDGGGTPAPTGNAEGKLRFAPGHARPGVDITPQFRAFLERMAAFSDRPIVVTTSTNRSKFTSSGNVSDQWGGNGADFGMVLNGGTDDGPVGDQIAAAAFMAAGLPRATAYALARAGGLRNLATKFGRVQIIWKTDEGGNHHNHVHVGLQPG